MARGLRAEKPNTKFRDCISLIGPVGGAALVLLLVGCAESRQVWPPVCEIQTLDGPGRMANHHFVERDPWPLTTGRYDYLDYLGLDEHGRARIQTTSGDIKALGFIGGVGAGTADLDTLRIARARPRNPRTRDSVSKCAR